MVIIKVPNLNDSVSRITLGKKDYNIRFTYNPSADSWYFSLFTLDLTPLIGMIKIVPLHDLLWQYVSTDLPEGHFGCWTNDDRVGKDSFINGRAAFGFISNEEVEE